VLQWGRTDVYEIELRTCDTTAPPLECDAQMDCGAGLVAHFRLDEDDSYGSACQDASPFTNHASSLGVVADGRFCRGRGFVESGPQGIEIESSPSLEFGLGSFSVMGWAKFDDYTYPRTSFVAKNGHGCYFHQASEHESGVAREGWNPGWEIGHGFNAAGSDVCIRDSNDNKARSVIEYDAGSRPLDLQGRWAHYAFVFSRATDGAHRVYAYIDGMQQHHSLDISNVRGSVDNGEPFTIGTLYGWKTDGTLDEFRLYNRAVAAADVHAIYEARPALDLTQAYAVTCPAAPPAEQLGLPLGPPPMNILTNGAMDGPVLDDQSGASILGWQAYNSIISIEDKGGRTGVVAVADKGGFSDLYQTVRTIPGETYDVKFDVFADPIENTAGLAICESTDSNGILDIREGMDVTGRHGEQRMCPRVAGQWTTVSGQYTATSDVTTFALHSESSWTAYFDSVEVTGPPPPPPLPEGCDGEELLNGQLKGPLTDGAVATGPGSNLSGDDLSGNTLPGWNTYNARLGLEAWPSDADHTLLADGTERRLHLRDMVLKVGDGGSFSEVHQTVRTVVGGVYTISFDVWADPIHNTAGKDFCSTTDSNGLLDIREGADQVNRHGEMRLCPAVAGEWATVTGTYVATAATTTVRAAGGG
jgi:hypothetical protein